MSQRLGPVTARRRNPLIAASVAAFFHPLYNQYLIPPAGSRGSSDDQQLFDAICLRLAISAQQAVTRPPQAFALEEIDVAELLPPDSRYVLRRFVSRPCGSHVASNPSHALLLRTETLRHRHLRIMMVPHPPSCRRRY